MKKIVIKWKTGKKADNTVQKMAAHYNFAKCKPCGS